MTRKIILGIETSCDDTSGCLLEINKDNRANVLKLQSFNQDVVLKKWGGVVPEIAARNHMEKISPLIESLFEDGVEGNKSFSPKDLHAIGVTTHPGLLGPLLTGLSFAKNLSLLFKTPIVPVNHLYAHLQAIHLTQEISYPYLGLVISGGHSIFFLVESPYEFEVLGTTIDDAAGEAFDKGGKLIGLGYPAGKIIDQMAKEGDPKKYPFPIGLKSSADAMMSFSGLKTSLRHFQENNPELIENPKELSHVCAGYQEAIAGALKLKLKYALKKTNLKNIQIVVGGGVACNSRIREVLSEAYPNKVFFVDPKYCTDNAAMIAYQASQTLEKNKIPYPESLWIDAKGRFLDKNQLQKHE